MREGRKRQEGMLLCSKMEYVFLAFSYVSPPSDFCVMAGAPPDFCVMAGALSAGV